MKYHGWLLGEHLETLGDEDDLINVVDNPLTLVIDALSSLLEKMENYESYSEEYKDLGTIQ